MPFMRVNNREMYYEDHGKGETILLLHHGFASSAMWKGIYPDFVAAGYRVVMVDRRGYGRSEPGDDFDRFYVSEEFCAESVEDLAILNDQLNLEDMHVVGQCEGGVLALIFAARFRDHVKSTVVASTLCHTDRTLVEFNAEKFPKSFFELDAPIREKMLEWHGLERAESFYEMARTKGGAYGVGTFDLRPLLPAVPCRTLILYPDRSALFEVEQAIDFYRGLPNGELAIIPRCGHNTYDQRPEDYKRLVMDFLKRVESSGRGGKEDFSMTCVAGPENR